jgi:polyribonucleotide nucleotidyltransferase
MEKRFSLQEFGYEVVIGKVAGQADGAAWMQQGGTIIVATAVSSPSKEFPGFFPLTVDYREQFAAAGKIPGGYLKREGKFSDAEVLSARLIDRAVRPLFPSNYFDQVQLLTTVYSFDKEHLPTPLALVGASLSLTLSKIPFMGPVGCCEIARINGSWVYNPTFAQSQESDVKIIVAGNDEGINMVEGSANQISETELVEILFAAHEYIKKQVAWQRSIAEEIGTKKAPIVDQFDWSLWTQRVHDILPAHDVERMFSDDKVVRSTVRDELESRFLTTYAAEIAETGVSETFLSYIFDSVLKDAITERIFALKKRIDGRQFDVVRQISTEVGLLPFNHGSALFTRGRTQALVSVTLGSGQDEARTENLLGVFDSNLMVHYNFHSFSVGEVRPNRGPGRREIGHGYLAASAIRRILPKKEAFPYVIRIVADILESDGSTSQATICGATMALMNAGVPITSMVSGVAMGLLGSADGKFQVLTDIAGIEDEFGLMDFKIAGTSTGICAVQMDIKYKGGLSRNVFEMALEAARKGRLYILGEMQKVMTAPNKKLSSLVPQFVTLTIPRDKIGAVIGSGGKTIREIIEKTGVASIDIEDDGLIKIFGQSEKLDLAVKWVQVLGGKIERGSIYNGIVKRIADFGIFVELVPGTDGLVHVSAIPRAQQPDIAKLYTPGMAVTVEVTDYDPESERIRLRIISDK